LGAPWALPYEFPLYQWIVVGVVRIFRTPLDQAGRAVALFFFYATLFPLYSLSAYLVKHISHKIVLFSFLLLNPIYLFWSRTFMIESLAWFLSVSFVWGIVKALHYKRCPYFVITVCTGVLASLTKVTTFVVWYFPALFACLYFWQQEGKKRYDLKIMVRYVGIAVLGGGFPILAASRWIAFADYQKSLNPIAGQYLTSAALSHWNWGTLEQRLDWTTWQQIFEWPLVIEMLENVSFLKVRTLNFFLLVGLFLLLGKRRRREVVFCFLGFLLGPLIFTNLYYIHELNVYRGSSMHCYLSFLYMDHYHVRLFHLVVENVDFYLHPHLHTTDTHMHLYCSLSCSFFVFVVM
jgi:hypothetical protein